MTTSPSQLPASRTIKMHLTLTVNAADGSGTNDYSATLAAVGKPTVTAAGATTSVSAASLRRFPLTPRRATLAQLREVILGQLLATPLRRLQQQDQARRGGGEPVAVVDDDGAAPPIVAISTTDADGDAVLIDSETEWQQLLQEHDEEVTLALQAPQQQQQPQSLSALPPLRLSVEVRYETPAERQQQQQQQQQVCQRQEPAPELDASEEAKEPTTAPAVAESAGDATSGNDGHKGEDDKPQQDSEARAPPAAADASSSSSCSSSDSGDEPQEGHDGAHHRPHSGRGRGRGGCWGRGRGHHHHQHHPGGPHWFGQAPPPFFFGAPPAGAPPFPPLAALGESVARAVIGAMGTMPERPQQEPPAGAQTPEQSGAATSPPPSSDEQAQKDGAPGNADDKQSDQQGGSGDGEQPQLPPWLQDLFRHVTGQQPPAGDHPHPPFPFPFAFAGGFPGHHGGPHGYHHGPWHHGHRGHHFGHQQQPQHQQHDAHEQDANPWEAHRTVARANRRVLALMEEHQYEEAAELCRSTVSSSPAIAAHPASASLLQYNEACAMALRVGQLEQEQREESRKESQEAPAGEAATATESAREQTITRLTETVVERLNQLVKSGAVPVQRIVDDADLSPVMSRRPLGQLLAVCPSLSATQALWLLHCFGDNVQAAANCVLDNGDDKSNRKFNKSKDDDASNSSANEKDKKTNDDDDEDDGFTKVL